MGTGACVTKDSIGSEEYAKNVLPIVFSILYLASATALMGIL